MVFVSNQTFIPTKHSITQKSLYMSFRQLQIRSTCLSSSRHYNYYNSILEHFHCKVDYMCLMSMFEAEHVRQGLTKKNYKSKL